MTDIYRLYRKIKDRWSIRRTQVDATAKELEFLVQLLDMMEDDEFGKDKDVPTTWISVKDRLPENHAICLTYSPKGVMRIAQAFIPSSIPGSSYDKMECWWSTHGVGGVHSVKATHWMPLPEPPKEGNGE